MLVVKNQLVIDHISTGKLVREARVKRGLSLLKMSEACGITPTLLAYLESGDRQTWSQERIDAVNAALEQFDKVELVAAS